LPVFGGWLRNIPDQGVEASWDYISGTQLERELKLQEYSVSNRGLRPNLVGTPEQVQERIAEYEEAGLDLLLLQMSPQAEETALRRPGDRADARLRLAKGLRSRSRSSRSGAG